ncbi:hypothetical protein JOF53_003626 [Crossiella equi]|uniref:DUF2993 domain-containing protein n=1 Tax=Crossiella equi TaxID=130796 RepID=A0ABS5ADV1_9PSEU|nr:hypothetical protein [Crossiella equi]MBP2474754.1 hypothetical protein [Crossiella equi]
MGTGDRRVSWTRIGGFIAGLALVAFLVAPLLVKGSGAQETAANEMRPLVGGEPAVDVRGLAALDPGTTAFEQVDVRGVDPLGNPVQATALGLDAERHRAESVTWLVTLPEVAGLNPDGDARFTGVVDRRRVEVVLAARIDGEHVLVVAESASVDGTPVSVDGLPDTVRAQLGPRRTPLPKGVPGVSVRALTLEGARPRVELYATAVPTGTGRR